MPTLESQEDAESNGINAFVFCEDVVDSLTAVWNTLKMFIEIDRGNESTGLVGSPVPQYMVDANLQFLKDTMQLEMTERTTQKVEIDPDLIQSGDFLGVLRLDGLVSIIMYGTGARIGHNVMALRMEDDELYIVES